ncbi:MAG: FAD-binding protein [Pseudomonadota bacterium]
MTPVNVPIEVQPPPTDWDLEIPLAIVGGGATGLTAATAAGMCGVECVVFERDSTPTGSTAMSYGSICAAGTKLQARSGLEDTTDALAEDIIAAVKGQTDPVHAHLLAQQSAITLDWFTEDLGLDFSIEVNWKGFGHRIPRLHGTPNRKGDELVAMLLNMSSDAGATLVGDAHVTTLYRAENGLIEGMSYTSPEGTVTVGCKALILASSGFAGNPDLIAEHIPKLSSATYYGAEWHKGEAVRWGKSLGAAMADMSSSQTLGNLAVPHNIVIPHTLVIDGGFTVNRDGKRFHNELVNISGQAQNVIEQPGHIGWIIYDQAGHDKASSLFAEYRSGLEVNAYRSAPDIPGLAAEIGVPSDALAETFGLVAKSAASGSAAAFGRSFDAGQELRAPYYAVKVTGALFHTQGGLEIDEAARVRLAGGGVIPNLFAGGGCARSVSGPSDWGYLPGIGLSTAVSFGRLAGESAAALVKQN